MELPGHGAGCRGFIAFPVTYPDSRKFLPFTPLLCIWPFLGCFAQGLGHWAVLLSFESPDAIAGVTDAVIALCSLINYTLDWFLLGFSPALVKRASVGCIVIGIAVLCVTDRDPDETSLTPIGEDAALDDDIVAIRPMPHPWRKLELRQHSFCATDSSSSLCD